MALTQVVVFAVLQGLTAVFPIGGGAHAALLRSITGWDNPSILSAAAEAGVLLAVIAFFWRDLLDMTVGLARMAKGKRDIHAGHEPPILTAGFGDSHGQLHLAGR